MLHIPTGYRFESEPDPALVKLGDFNAENVRADLPRTEVYRDIAHWFVFATFTCFIAGIVLGRI